MRATQSPARFIPCCHSVRGLFFLDMPYIPLQECVSLFPVFHRYQVPWVHSFFRAMMVDSVASFDACIARV